MNWIKKIFSKKETTKQCDIQSVRERFEIGDKVGFSDKTLEGFGSCSKLHSNKVYEVVDKKVSTWQGIMLVLHCGTTLMDYEAKKLPKETPLNV